MPIKGVLAKNSIYNLLGNGLPLLVGLVTLPRLVHTLGVDRFGVLTLTWTVLGYFSLFDLGLGRALTQIVAERSGCGNREELPDIIRTALIMLFLLGVVGGICLAVASPLIVGRALKLSPALHGEVLSALNLMAFSLPAVILLAGLRGILEARQFFLKINILRLAMGVLTFLGPWLVSFKTANLFWVVLSLVVMRYGALIAHYWVCTNAVPEMSVAGAFQSNHCRALLKFGGWMTVSNIVSPLMVNLDRFFIGAFVSVGAVAYYATPFDMVTKVLAVPSALVSVLFPMFGFSHRVNANEVVRLYRKGLKIIFLVLAPCLLFLGAGAHLILLYWLGSDFAQHGSGVMRILCLGVLINALAHVPFAFIQGVARPDLTAKLHLAEAPLYLAILWGLGTHFGIVGVAWAWCIRVTFDLLLLLFAAQKLQAHITLPTASELPLLSQGAER
jgi:O-antigen/teichoic acid export membrane protein